jgi:tight adherence protein B
VTSFLAAACAAAAVVVTGRPPPAARLPGEPRRPPGASGIGCGFAVLAIAVGVPVVVVVGSAVAAVAARRALAARAQARLRQARTSDVVELTVALAGELRAGRSPVEALAAAAPTAGSLRSVVEAAEISGRAGAGAGEILLAAAALPGAERLRWTAAAWSVADAAGGRVADVLDRVATAMDDEEEVRQELAAALAAPRATIVLLAGLPAFGVVIGQAIGAHPLGLLLHRPLGWALIGAALLLDLAGIGLTKAIARAALDA